MLSTKLLDMQPLSYTVQDAAKAIGICRSNLWKIIAADEIATFRVGKRRLIRADELQAFLDRKTAQSAMS